MIVASWKFVLVPNGRVLLAASKNHSCFNSAIVRGGFAWAVARAVTGHRGATSHRTADETAQKSAMRPGCQVRLPAVSLPLARTRRADLQCEVRFSSYRCGVGVIVSKKIICSAFAMLPLYLQHMRGNEILSTHPIHKTIDLATSLQQISTNKIATYLQHKINKIAT